MNAGKVAADDLLVSLLVEKIKEVGKDRGYILDGFPSSVSQARLLEQALAGIEDAHVAPKPLPPNSRLAPPVPEQLETTGDLPSGLLLYLRLHVGREVSIRRRMGRLRDPDDPDGPCYHVEFDPPPPEDSALASRLEEVVDEDGADMSLLTRVSSYLDEKAALDAWFARFSNKVEVMAEGSTEEVFEEVKAAVVKQLEEREKEGKEEEEEEGKKEEDGQEEAKLEEKGEEEKEEGEGDGEKEVEDRENGEALEEEKAPEVLPIHEDVANLLLQQWRGVEGTFELEVRWSWRGEDTRMEE
eukprot:257734-Hanusia_phi.AAC.2